MENWKQIKEFPNYEISDLGKVRYNSNGRIKIRKLLKTSNGYLKVNLSHNKIIKTKSVHKLVAVHFLGDCSEGIQVNHIDGDKNNNCLSNLEYVTQFENAQHAWKTGLCGDNIRYFLARCVVDKQTGIFYDSIKDACFYTNKSYVREKYYQHRKKHLCNFI